MVALHGKDTGMKPTALSLILYYLWFSISNILPAPHPRCIFYLKFYSLLVARPCIGVYNIVCSEDYNVWDIFFFLVWVYPQF